MSCLDKTPSFLQIEIEEEIRDCTSFIFEGRNLRLTRLAFGIKTSMQHYKKGTKLTLGPEVEEFCDCYVDDFKIDYS